VTSVEDLGVVAGMTFSGRDEADPAVAVFLVIPADEALHPVPRNRQSGEAIHRVSRHVFAGAKQRLRVGIVVADARPTERGLDIHVAEFFQKRRRLECTAVIGMQHERLLDHMLGQDRTFENALRIVCRLTQKDLPADDLAAEDVDDHHQIVVGSLDRSG
jgi:hypothetical protein